MLAALGFPILVQQRKGVEVGLLRAKVDGAPCADIALLLGPSWSSPTSSALGSLSLGESLGPAVQGQMMA